MHRARAGAASVIARAALRKERKAKRVHESRVCELRSSEMADRSADNEGARGVNRESPRVQPTRPFVSFVPSPYFFSFFSFSFLSFFLSIFFSFF